MNIRRIVLFFILSLIASAPAVLAQTSETLREVEVIEGDTLSKYYQEAGLKTVSLAEFAQGVRRDGLPLAHPDHIEVGWVLTLPAFHAEPTATSTSALEDQEKAASLEANLQPVTDLSSCMAVSADPVTATGFSKDREPSSPIEAKRPTPAANATGWKTMFFLMTGVAGILGIIVCRLNIKLGWHQAVYPSARTLLVRLKGLCRENDLLQKKLMELNLHQTSSSSLFVRSDPS